MNYKAIIASITIFFVFALSLASFAKNASGANDWAQWRGPNRDGISVEKGWLGKWQQSGPKQLWKHSVGVGYSAVSVSNGRAYTMGNANKTDTIYCLDANTGAEVWKHSYPCVAEGNEHPGTAATPTIDSGFVYTQSRDGDLFCLDAKSGKVIWYKNLIKDFGATPPTWSIACSPLVLGKKLIVTAGMTMALDKSNGSLIWKTQNYDGGYSSPYAFDIGKAKYLAIFNTLGLVILNPENGQEICSQPWKTSYNVNAATPIVSGDKIFISSGYNVGGALYQFSGNKLIEIWKNKEMRNHFNSCVLWQGNLYGFDEVDLKCLDFQTGTVKWKQGGMGKGSLMIADGKLIIMSDNGKLVIAEASPASYNELASAKVMDGLCWTVPVLSNGKIYCRNHEGELICVDPK